MTLDITRGDAGRPPQPHYCSTRPRTDGTIAGCPQWPACLFAESRERIVTAADDVTAERLAHLVPSAVDADAAKREDWSDLGRDLAALTGWAFGAVLVIVVVLLLLPVLAP